MFGLDKLHSGCTCLVAAIVVVYTRVCVCVRVCSIYCLLDLSSCSLRLLLPTRSTGSPSYPAGKMVLPIKACPFLGMGRPPRSNMAFPRNGHTRNRALPTKSSAGIGPKFRESDELSELSPSSHKCPSGTTCNPPRCRVTKSPGKPNTLLHTVPFRSGCCTTTTSPTLTGVVQRCQKDDHVGCISCTSVTGSCHGTIKLDVRVPLFFLVCSCSNWICRSLARAARCAPFGPPSRP